MNENNDHLRNTFSLVPGGSQIQINSISIDISSGDINEAIEACEHFTIRGYVAELLKKDRTLCSPFTSDGDYNNSGTPPMDLPPLEAQIFRWWRCNSCVQDSNSSQGTSKEIGTSKNLNSRSLIGLSKLYERATANGFTVTGSTYSQRPGKRKHVQEDDEILREPLHCFGNSQRKLPPKLDKGKRVMKDGYSQGPSKENSLNSRGASLLKSINEAVMVPFNGINFDKATSSRKSGKEPPHLQKCSSSRGGLSKVVMGPPGGFSQDKATSPKPSKEQNLQKELSMPPPGGFSNSKQRSQKPGKGSRVQDHNTSSRGVSKDAAMHPTTGSASGKSTSAPKQFKQQNVQTPKPNSRAWHKGDSSAAATSNRKKNYAKRSVQQAEIAGDKREIHKGGENGFARTFESDNLQHGAAKDADLPIPERFNGDKVPLDLDRNEDPVEKSSNLSTAGRTSIGVGQNLLDPDQFVQNGVGSNSCLDSDGPDNRLNSVRPSVQSNRLFNGPGIDRGHQAGRNNMYDEEEEEDFRGSNLRRAPKIRLLSDVIAKHSTNVGEQPVNSKTSPGASNDISAKVCEQSTKRKASPVESHDTSAERGDPLKKRKKGDNEELLPESLVGGSKRMPTRFAEPENKGVPTSRYRPAVEVSAEGTVVTDAKKQGKHTLGRNEAEKKSKKARVQDVGPFAAPSQPRHESIDRSERSLPSERGSSGEAAVSKNLKNISSADKAERVLSNGKKNTLPQIRDDCQTANKLLQFGPDNIENVPGDSTSDCVYIGSGLNRRNDVGEKSSSTLSTLADFGKMSISTGKELWIPQVQAGGTLVEFKGGEGSSCAPQKGSTAEGKGRMKDIDINSIPVDDKTPEQGYGDDIPMDIVELLARHQHEKEWHANREKFIPVEQQGGTAAQKSYPNMLKPQASYASNGFGRQFEAMGSGKQILSDNMFDQSRKNVLVGYPKDDHFCARFSGYTQSQGQVPGGAQYSSSMGSTAKSWNGKIVPLTPPSRTLLQPQPVSSFGRYPSGQSTPLNTQIWPPLLSGRVPVGGLANQGMYSQGSKANQGPISFNFERTTIGNSKASSSQPPWHSRFPVFSNTTRQKATEFPNQKMIRPVDLSSNETIPAMQLLNLVQVASSRSSTPPVNGNNHQQQYKQYAPGPHFEPYKPLGGASSSRHPLYDGEGRSAFADKRCPCSSALPTAHRFPGSPFQNEAINFTSRDQRNMGGGSCYNAAVLGTGGPEKRRRSTSGSKNAVVGQGYGPQMPSFNLAQPMRNPVPVIDLCNERAVVAVNTGEVCMVNRNPAEMLDLKEVRSFMIGPEDLRRGKPMPSSRIAPNARRPQTILRGRGRERLQKS